MKCASGRGESWWRLCAPLVPASGYFHRKNTPSPARGRGPGRGWWLPAQALLLTALLCLLYTPSAWATALTWTGGGADTDFNTAANWSPSQTPTTSDACTINATTVSPNNQPTIATNATCGSLIVGSGGQVMTLSMSSNKNLDITGNVTFGANGYLSPSGTPTGVFTVGGNWTDTIGTNNITSTTMGVSYKFTGASKTITSDDRFYLVQFNGSYTLAATSNLQIYNSLDISNGNTLTHAANSRISLRANTFTVNGSYTYPSIATAYIDVYGSWAPAAQNFPNITVKSGGTVTGANGTIVDYDMTVDSGGNLVTGQNLTVGGSFINNGTVNAANSVVTLSDAGFAVSGAHAQLGGSTTTTFNDLYLGDASGTDVISVTQDLITTTTFNVATGATATVTGGKNITAGSGTTINGTLTLSGTTTLAQTGGSNANSIKVYGTFNATGTDTSNRVTITHTGATVYDFIFFAGSTINFNKVNIYYTTKTQNNGTTGFQILGTVTAFQYVAFNYSEDGNGAIMMRYAPTSPLTAVAAPGCSFSSATYTSGSDINVEAVTGILNLTSYYGNFSGETRDYDNGGTATWSLDITGTVFEDANFNGTAAEWDSAVSDKAINGVDVELYDSATSAYISSTTTNASGVYSFTSLTSKDYKVRVRSATISNGSTSTPQGGFNACVPASCAYPMPDMVWALGAARYGGASASVDDTATGDNAGPGDTYVIVPENPSTNAMNMGFAYNLIVNTTDDANAVTSRSAQGSLRQFIKNANAIGTAASNTASSSQFRMGVAVNQASWWRITALANLPDFTDAGTTLDGSTQRVNAGADTNTAGPEIEIYGNNAYTTGLKVNNVANITIQEMAVSRFTQDGITVTGASASGNVLYGNYVGISANGSTSQANGRYGILVESGAASQIGGLSSGQGNLVAYNTNTGIYVSSAASSSQVLGNSVRNNGAEGILSNTASVQISKNLVYSNGTQGITASSNSNLLYHNTAYANGGDGLRVLTGVTGTILRNNISVGNTGYGINKQTATITETYNLVTSAAVSPANGSGQINSGSLDSTDLNANPAFTNAGSGDFTLQSTSPAINRGCNLGSAGDDTVCDNASDAAQPDVNGATAGNYNGYAPDLGAYESSVITLCPVATVADSGYASLRDCLTYANSNPGTTISFSIYEASNQSAGADSWWRISALSALPNISAASTVIDGSTQTSNIGNNNSLGPEIEIYGAGAGATHGLTVNNVGSVTIKNLVVNGFAGDGIYVTGAGANGTIIQGNYIGTNAVATAAIANGYRGIEAHNGCSNTTIGGASAGQGNILSGNTWVGASIWNCSNTTIYGNIIGTGVVGTENLGNGLYGVEVTTSGASTSIGGLASGQGNVIANNAVHGVYIQPTAGASNVIYGNTIRSNANTGIYSDGSGVVMAKNMVRSNGSTTSHHGIELAASGATNKVYHNTVHGNSGDGIRVGVTGATIKNNNITGNGAYGINRVAASMTEDYNNVTNAATTPANVGGQSNVTLGTYTYSQNPLYNNLGGNDYSLTECTSPLINTGVDLVADQPDINGATAGSFNNGVPDRGAYETSTACTLTLPIVKQAWEEGASAAFAAPGSVPVNYQFVFLLYVKNNSSAAVTDVRLQDLLADSNFEYQTGTMYRSSAVSPPADTATDLQIFNATASGTGTLLTDALDADVASFLDTNANTKRDKLTVGAVSGQANGSLTIDAHTTFAIRFKVKFLGP